jgi:predicted Zn-dependent protease with MMP-like domain
MKIRNINVSKDLIRIITYSDIQLFVLDVIRPLEEELYWIENEELEHKCDYDYPNHLLKEHIRISSYGHYEYIATLVHTIPIYLKDKGMSVEEDRELEGENCIDLLGAYFQNISQNNESNPYIELYVDRIYDYANMDNEKFKWLFAITLIHELAHAVLDNYNLSIIHRHVTKLRYNSEFRKWREESMANAIALRIIKDFGDIRFFDYAIKFMWSQPAEYALGVLMEDFNWRDMRSVMDNKYEGVDQTLQDQWLDYVKGNPDWQGLKKWNERLGG